MLGVDCTVRRSESVRELAPGSTVLLYTDGLVERHGSTLDVGTHRLCDLLREFGGRPLGELCDALLDGMLQGSRQDDVAIVAVRLPSTHPER